MRTSEVLRGAVAKVVQSGWVQGVTEAVDSGAVCLEGALLHGAGRTERVGVARQPGTNSYWYILAEWGGLTTYQPLIAARAVCAALITDPRAALSNNSNKLWRWNDHVATSKDEVIALLTRAAGIAELEERVNSQPQPSYIEALVYSGAELVAV